MAEPAGASPWPSSAALLRRAGKTAAACLAVVFSLLAFPSVVPWMVAFWLAVHGLAVLRGRSGPLPLACVTAVLLVKRIDWPFAFYALAAALLAALVWSGYAALRKDKLPARSALVSRALLIVLAAAWVAFAWNWHTTAHASRRWALKEDRPVVLLGDSLTSGAPPDAGYAGELRKRITLPVVDLSQYGITTTEGLRRLPQLRAARPQVVVLELGGHDFLKGYRRDVPRANLERIIAVCHQIGAAVVLMELPRDFISDPYAGLERQLAREHDLQLVSDTPVRWLVLMSPFAPPGMWLDKDLHLSDDGLHPNARGNQVLADAVAAALIDLYGEEMQAKNTTP